MVMTKTSNLTKNQAQAIVGSLFKNFQAWITQPQDPTISEIEKIFSRDFQLTSNGLLASKDLADHVKRLAKLRKKYSRIEVKESSEEPLVSDHKFAVYYTLHLTSHTRQESLIDIMAIATVEDNKIKRWIQVAHEKGKDWHS